MQKDTAMQDYPQGPGAGAPPAGQSRGRFQGIQQGIQQGFQGALDPRHYDPRRAIDRQQIERLARAQAIARAKAQATSTVFLATVVSLATSAFGVVAALAWNQAISENIQDLVRVNSVFKGLSPHILDLVYAIIITLLAVIVIITLNRIASRIAKKSAIDAAEADAGSI